MTGFRHWVQHEACASLGLGPISITIQIRLAQGHRRGGGEDEISHNSHGFLPPSPKSVNHEQYGKKKKKEGIRTF